MSKYNISKCQRNDFPEVCGEELLPHAFMVLEKFREADNHKLLIYKEDWTKAIKMCKKRILGLIFVGHMHSLQDTLISFPKN